MTMSQNIMINHTRAVHTVILNIGATFWFLSCQCTDSDGRVIWSVWLIRESSCRCLVVNQSRNQSTNRQPNSIADRAAGGYGQNGQLPRAPQVCVCVGGGGPLSAEREVGDHMFTSLCCVSHARCNNQLRGVFAQGSKWASCSSGCCYIEQELDELFSASSWSIWLWTIDGATRQVNY